MSRRLILLATTFYVAIGSFAAVGPVSAHGFGVGGFSGGRSGPAFTARSSGTPGLSNIGRTLVQSMNNFGGGGRFEHAPVGAPAVQNSAAVSRIETARIAAAANAPMASAPAATQSVHPAQLPQTISSSGIVSRQPDAAGIVTAPVQSRLSAAGIVTAPVTARIPVNPADLAKAADMAREKRIEALRQKKKDLMAQEFAIKAQIIGTHELIAELEIKCKAEIKAAEQSLQDSGGGAAAGAVIGGVVGGPLGALAGAAVGATIGGAESGGVTFDLSACKQLGDLQKQLSDLLGQLSVTQAALAGVDAALAKAVKEQAAEEAPQQLLDAKMGNLAGPSRPQGATK
jgi:hypothetical protein